MQMTAAAPDAVHMGKVLNGAILKKNANLNMRTETAYQITIKLKRIISILGRWQLLRTLPIISNLEWGHNLEF